MRQRPVIFSLLSGGILGMLFLVTGCSEPEADPVIRPVRAIVLGQADVRYLKEYPARVDTPKKVDLAFRVSGPLIDLPVLEGKKVQANDVLAEVDPRDFETTLAQTDGALDEAKATLSSMKLGARPEDISVLEAKVAAAEAEELRAKQQQERSFQLLEDDLISKDDHDRNVTTYEVAKAQLKRAKLELQIGKTGARPEDIQAMESKIDQLEAQRKAAFDALQDTKLRAPFDGRISQRFVQNFQRVIANEPIVSLQNLSELEIVIDVPERDLVQLPKDAKKTIVARFDSLPDRDFELEVKEWTTEADPQTQTFRVRLLMESPEDVTILPGMTATCQLEIAKKEQAEPGYLIPIMAAFERDGKTYVWLIDKETMTTAKKQIKLGEVTGGNVWVTDGLKQGQTVVTAGVHTIHDGQKVRIFDRDTVSKKDSPPVEESATNEVEPTEPEPSVEPNSEG